MKQATHYIEQVKYDGGFIKSLNPHPIKNLRWALEVSERSLTCETIAIFKVYPKPKPAIAHYDNTVNAIIIE